MHRQARARRALLLLLATVFLVAALSGCGKTVAASGEPEAKVRLQRLLALYQQYRPRGVIRAHGRLTEELWQRHLYHPDEDRGLSQMLALVPGVSRSGATIIGGLAAGLDRPTAAEFSFFLAIPTLAAAFAHSALEMRHQLTADRLTDIGIGFVFAFLASLVVVKPFLAVVRRSGFAPFAWYRIAAGVAMLAALGAGWL